MGWIFSGAARRGAAFALALAALGCARPLATFTVAEAAAGAESSASRSRRVLAIAKRYLGARYVWGGASPSGFDCSGFVMYVYRQVGVSLPHKVAKQYRYGRPVIRARLEPGDVVFFDRLHHNGIYLGDGRFIHAGRSGGGVTISRLDESWYRSRWNGGRRF